MTKPPSILYRSLNCSESMLNHLEGKLWFRSLKYFHQIESIGRDEMEGVGSYTVDDLNYYDIDDRETIQSVFIMSFSEVRLPEYGQFFLALQEPLQFKQKIEQRILDSFRPGRDRVKWRKVTYNKTRVLSHELSPVADWKRKYWEKPERFASEKEWRLLIFLPPPLRLLDNTIKPHIGSLESLFKILPDPLQETCG